VFTIVTFTRRHYVNHALMTHDAPRCFIIHYLYLG